VGVNEFPRYIHPYPERLISPEKYSWIEHAERNSLYFAANRGIRTRGLIMVCPWVACTDCARGIVQAGIVEVISHNFDLHSTVPHWEDSIGKALQMFKEAAVEYREIDGKYGVDIMFNDEKVTV
jgi:dCMP deaminase